MGLRACGFEVKQGLGKVAAIRVLSDPWPLTALSSFGSSTTSTI